LNTAEPLTDAELRIRDGLRRHVEVLAGEIGERHVFNPPALEAAAAYVERELQALGYRPQTQPYLAHGREVRNIEVEIPGVRRPDRIVVAGAHYDSIPGCPAANDNGSGVAALLEIARVFKGLHPPESVRLVFFVNEEPPFFQTEEMGSLVYARRCGQRGENVVGMLSLETIGCYRDEPGSQVYPLPSWYARTMPSRGNFLAFVGNVGSWRLTRRCRVLFGLHSRNFPTRWAALPSAITGIGWSDHWSFWQAGYPAVMATDTAPFRYPHYHRPTDTPDKLDYDRTARVTAGLAGVIASLAGAAATAEGST
jgi:Zn-dependent M28 family amino/carboxypeptidase